MSVAVRVIPCLDIADGQVVKGVNFAGLRTAGDPVDLAGRYDAAGADELLFLDVTATVEGRSTTVEVLERVAAEVFIPLTVGGGVRSVADVEQLLQAGADKVGINSAAVSEPGVIDRIASRFGNQVLVLSIDVRRSAATPSGFVVTTHGGRTDTGRDAVQWAREAAERGVGEVLLNSIDADGTTAGFDTPMIAALRDAVTVPLVASGGAGCPEHFPTAIAAGADAVLAASFFHFGPNTAIGQVKMAIADAGYTVREQGLPPSAL